MILIVELDCTILFAVLLEKSLGDGGFSGESISVPGSGRLLGESIIPLHASSIICSVCAVRLLLCFGGSLVLWCLEDSLDGGSTSVVWFFGDSLDGGSTLVVWFFGDSLDGGFTSVVWFFGDSLDGGSTLVVYV